MVKLITSVLEDLRFAAGIPVKEFFVLPDHRTYYKHQDSRIKKAQELKTKTSANSDIQDLPLRYQVYQRRLLAKLLIDDCKVMEHDGQDTMIARWQRRSKKQRKDLKISD
ncbi:hypothetical protein Tco_0361401 [Tanacetum coccineum]